MRVGFPQFVLRDIARVALLMSVMGLWVFSGFNLFFDLRKNGIENSSSGGQVLAEQSLVSALPTVFPSASPSATPEIKVISSQLVLPSISQAPAQRVSPDSSNNLTGEVIKFREQNGKGSLSQPSSVCDFAKERLSELQTNYSHDGFSEMKEKTGEGTAAENIARTSKNMGGHYVVFDMWAKSDGHRNNMLGDYTEGCGYYDGRYAVLILGK